jgi:hypothetical protein
MRAIGPTLEFRMSLGRHPEGVIRKFNELNETPIGRYATAYQARFFETRPIHRVKFISMSVTFAHHWLAVCGMHL